MLKDIKFATNVSQIKGKGKIASYQGQIHHNEAWDFDRTCKELSLRCNSGNVPLARLYLESIGEIMKDAVKTGTRVNFGSFILSLKLRGSFPVANAPYDPETNRIAVELTPTKELRESVKTLNPINDVKTKPVIYKIFQQEPPVNGRKKTAQYGVLSADGSRKVKTDGNRIHVHAGVSDEFVRIENDNGEVLITGEVYHATDNCCDANFEGHLDPGDYWYVINSRSSGDSALLSVRRRVKVI